MPIKYDTRSDRVRDSPVVSVVIPAFNEELTVGKVIQRTCHVLEELNFPFEVIVVDDGSHDQTALVCERRGAKVVRNGHKMGKGIALRKAFDVCRGDVIVTLDADCSHWPKEIPRLIAPILNDGFDVTLGSRIFDLRSPLKVRIRHLGNLIFSFLISLFSGEKVLDSQCGLRAFRSHVVKEMNFSSRRFEIESEMLIKLIKKKCRFVEVPIGGKFSRARMSNVNVLIDGLMIFLKILSCSMNTRAQFNT